jgi:recombination protein RecT
MIGGLFKKARNSGEIASITTHVVYQRDYFKFVLGDDEKIEHTPILTPDRGEPVAAYAIVKTKDGAVYREVMSIGEINKVREVSRAKNDGPWVSWWEEMARKTVFRRLAKRLPSSADLEQALEHEAEVVGNLPTGSGPSLLDPPPPIEHGPTRTQSIVADAMRATTSDAAAPGEVSAPTAAPASAATPPASTTEPLPGEAPGEVGGPVGA